MSPAEKLNVILVTLLVLYLSMWLAFEMSQW